MVKYSLVFGAAFALAAALANLPGCVLSDGCSCPPLRERPDAQGPLTDLTVTSYDAQGNAAPDPITQEAGTLELTPESVVITYGQDSVAFRVEYDVVGPSTKHP